MVNQGGTAGVRATALGQHLIADFYGASQLFDGGPAAAMLHKAAEAAGATVLDLNLHDFGDRYGFTGVALLAESHISVHTWPENDYVAIDIFMCGDAKPELSLEVLRSYFTPSREHVQNLKRGVVAAAVDFA
ncbi:adenosylmethionine decarboxylase [Litoreibacter albidus]|uniref:adenosylmethionine decarboxylase n=1 Tax=Litoreibacter albidus TaxID=670155 RepID=UPI003735787C